MVKRMYGLLEKQFLRVVKEAERRTGNSGDIMLHILEQRFDNAVYRLGLAPSRQSARQLVTHGHFMLNGRRVDIPSIQLKPGDQFTVRPKSAEQCLLQATFSGSGRKRRQCRWLTFDPKKMAGKVTGAPGP